MKIENGIQPKPEDAPKYQRPPVYLYSPDTPPEVIEQWYRDNPQPQDKPIISNEPYPAIWGK